MTAEQLTEQLSLNSRVFQTWVDAEILGDDGGALYLSSIDEGSERIGTAHVYIWSRSAMGQPGQVRVALKRLMVKHGLDRAVAQIDADNHLAIKLARRMGGNEVGVLRQRKNSSGYVRDTILFDMLPGDFDG